MKPLLLTEIAAALGANYKGYEICTSISSDSRKMDKGSVFVAIVGEVFDGHKFVDAAFDKGAVAAVISNPDYAVDGKPCFVVDDTKDAYIKLIPEVQEALQDYLQSRKHWKKTDPLFAGTGNRARGGRLEVPSFSRIIKTIFKEAGYDSNKLTAHSLRHTSNTLLFKSGADLYTVQQHARHSDPKTTEIYIHAVDREKDRSEQNIYNQIFRPGQKDTEEIASEMMQQLSEEDKLKALEFIRKLSSASAVQKVV